MRFVVLVLAGWLWVSAGLAQEQEFDPLQSCSSAQSYLNYSASRGFDLSPDGKRILYIYSSRSPAYQYDVGFTSALVVLGWEEGELKAKISTVPGNIFAARWMDNDKLMFVVSIPYAKMMIVHQNWDSTNRKVKTAGVKDKRFRNKHQGLPRLESWLPYDPDHALFSFIKAKGQYYSSKLGRELWKVNIRTGKMVSSVDLGLRSTAAWAMDKNGNPRFRLDISSSGKVARIKVSGGKTNDWQTVSTYRLRDSERQLWPVAFDPVDPDLVFVRARKDGADHLGIYHYRMSDHTLLDEVFTPQGYDVEDAIRGSSEQYKGSYFLKDKLVYQFSDPNEAAIYRKITEKFAETTSVHVVDVSENDQHWLLKTTGPDDPGSLYIYQLEGNQLTFVTHESGEEALPLSGRPQTVQWTGRDGMALSGYLTLPPDQSSGKLPMVVYPHGGPELRDYLRFDADVAYLATRGYAVFQPNFRGSAGFGKSFAEAGYRKWGDEMQHDISDGVLALIESGKIDAERICIYGGSYGGYAALAGAAFTPDLYQCAISMAGVSDLPKMMKWERKNNEKEIYQYWTKVLGDESAETERLARVSPARHADAFTIPVLLIHGKKDDVVPIEQSEIMLDALRDAGKDVSVIRFKSASHSSWPHYSEALEDIEKFLDTHIGDTNQKALINCEDASFEKFDRGEERK
jgi:dipeptidyl aminopeptidase/acylaminoacyl peptidase